MCSSDLPVIPYEHSLKLLDKAREPKAMVTVPGGSHIDAFTDRYGSKYQDAVVEFFATALAAN